MLSPARTLLRRSAPGSLALAIGRRSALSTSTPRQLAAASATDGEAPAKPTSWPIVQSGYDESTRSNRKIVVERPESKTLPTIEARWSSSALYVRAGTGSASQQTKLHAATLRDNCACATCRDPSSGQKSFATPEINNKIGIANVRKTDAGLAITFGNDISRLAADGQHETVLSWQSIELALGAVRREELTVPPARPVGVLHRTGVVHWDKEVLAREVRKIDYEAYMQGGEAFWDAVIDICRFGIVFLKNVPRDEDSVVKITTQIANIRETFYGRTFDVVAKPNAENVAYTSGYLGLHQDLLYLAPPPKIQILHCMDNSCEGGESLFSDGDRVGRMMWSFGKHAIHTLAKTFVPYAYNKNGYNYEYRRPIIDTDNAGNYRNVFWSPPFQGGHAATWNIKPLLSPARLFEQLINDEEAVYRAKLQPGECVLFDNLRVMHGRTAFDAAGGSRWLRGAYISEEDFFSKASHIPQELADKYRGPLPWTPSAAMEELMESPWYASVKKKVQRLGDDLPEIARQRMMKAAEEEV